MRFLLPVLMLLSACSPDAPEPVAEKALYAGEGRDRLCVSGDRAGFIVYGKGNANCSAVGSLAHDGSAGTFVPRGDEDCRIPLRLEGERVALGRGDAACAYYCGPGASFEGKALAKDESASAAVDFAGDPLC